jgi:hypothetical protein
MVKVPYPPQLRLLGQSEGVWWDMQDHRTRGTVWLYLAEGNRSGQWLISVKVHEDETKALVKVVGSELTSFKHSQFWGDRKNHNFFETKDGRHFYHQLGIGEVGSDWRGRVRVRSRRQMTRKSLPKTFKRYFRGFLKRHSEVSPKTGWAKRGHALAESLVIVLRKSDTDLMAWSYVLEKLQPLFRDRLVRPQRTSLSFFA